MRIETERRDRERGPRGVEKRGKRVSVREGREEEMRESVGSVSENGRGESESGRGVHQERGEWNGRGMQRV